VTALASAYLERLGTRIETVGSCLCLGLDPDPDALPPGFAAGVAGIERLARMLLHEAGPYAAAVKANVAFFEAFGSAGIAALERIRAEVPPELPFILDAKRADIGSTAARQAVALFDALGADAVTANPYLGLDALEPLLGRDERFVYLLCRTSNPGAADIQDLVIAGEGSGAGGERLPLYLHVARLAAAWAAKYPRLGLVCGATAPTEMALVREAAPELPFLVPGVGAQGGDLAAVQEHGPARSGAAGEVRGGALLVNVSRSIAAPAAVADDPATAIRAAARDWSAKLKC
jgi:orotidine-5'-phosphate decarboxylase